MNDIINGLFEVGMAIAIFFSLRRLYEDKGVKGWSVFSVIWPTSWGYWNLYYYPRLHQWFSLVGGIFVVMANTAWIIMALYYRKRKENKGK
jgi:hypothetical protein